MSIQCKYLFCLFCSSTVYYVCYIKFSCSADMNLPFFLFAFILAILYTVRVKTFPTLNINSGTRKQKKFYVSILFLQRMMEQSSQPWSNRPDINSCIKIVSIGLFCGSFNQLVMKYQDICSNFCFILILVSVSDFNLILTKDIQRLNMYVNKFVKTVLEVC